MTTHDHDEHVVAWWAHERGHVGETALQRRIALDFRDKFLTFVDSYLDGETELLGERVGGPYGITAATNIKVMRYPDIPPYGVLNLPVSPEFLRQQRRERNERAVAWLRHATGQGDSP